MVKVNVGTMSAQASSVSAIVSQRVSALTDAKQSLSSFASQDQLKGAAYQNAKAYATSVLGPLIDGMILLSEETEKGVTKLQTLYAEKCGSESLDSEVLTDKIEKDQELLIKIQDLQAHLEKHASFLSHALDGLEATVKARLRKNKKKLKNLMEFNAESSSVFEALAEFQDSVSAGLSFVSTGFNNFNGTFDTSGKGLEWTKTIQTGMKKREDSKAEELRRKKVIETVKNIRKYAAKGVTIASAVEFAKEQDKLLKKFNITIDSKGRVKMDKTFLYRKGKDAKSEHVYKNGSEKYKETTGKDFDVEKTNILRGRKLDSNGNLKIDFDEVSKSGKNAAIKSLKSEVLDLRPKNAFKGWGELGKLAKAGKVLGWTGKIANIYSNGKKDFFDDKTSTLGQKVRNFAVDSGVDALSGAGSAAAGAAIGTMVGGPVGTVVGAVAGIAIGAALDAKIFNGNSVTGFAKNGLKSLAGGLGF
ncbi:hypothetical protein [Streptococcus uberis]|uniref:hypothetical protein n=1 Tax=Streptococcus uberis TaxID=1349 RepID=UPI001EF0BC5A|nr:hypothetical protein [Streptococcus uberis]